MQASLNPNITNNVRKSMLLAMTEYKLERKCEARGFIIKLSIFLKRNKNNNFIKTNNLFKYVQQTNL